MTHLEASLELVIPLETIKRFMRQHGTINPVLYLLSKERTIEVKTVHPNIVTRRIADTPSENGIYKTFIGLRMRTPEDADMITKIAQSVTHEYSPEAVALFLTCLYKEYHGEDPGDLEFDPDSMRVLHGCYYLRDDSQGMVMQLPYLHRGDIPGVPEPSEFNDEEIDRYDITFAEYHWTKSLPKVEPAMPNPYII